MLRFLIEFLFDKPDFLLDIVKGRNSYHKWGTKAFASYQSKFVLATFDEMKTKFADKDKYRYYMYYDTGSEQINTPTHSQAERAFNNVEIDTYYISDTK